MFVPSLVDIHLSFQFFMVMNKAAINLHVRICMGTYVFVSLG